MSKENHVVEVVNVSAWKVVLKLFVYTIVVPSIVGLIVHAFALGVFRTENYLGHQLGEVSDAVAQAAGYQLPSAQENYSLDDVIDLEATLHDIHPDLVRSIIKQESRGNGWAESSVGAMGLMQLMPDTVKACVKAGILKDGGAAYDEKQNVKCGVWWLKHSLREQNNSINRALQNYNGGPRCIDRCEESIGYAKSVMATFATRSFGLKKVNKS
jgi:soluble lytic murein transglycosylase-like protein